ncbi:uncharacterized protein LOC141856587 [Brevipalpus obovatus]|uniref:uncharacterized protein LOC141856587 n=1 Tax=Brevipalpus obovatus TaxID=246614 RepID=UPI003D9F8623
MFDHKFTIICALILKISTINCKNSPPPPGKILYGKDADSRDFPYIVAILHPDAEKGVPNKTLLFGAGSIIGDKWIITSKPVAMDLEKSPPVRREMVIYPKYENDLSHMLTTKPKAYKVEKAFCAPKIQSDWKDSQSDLAVLKLTESIPLDKGPENFKSISMTGEKRKKVQLRVAGWGMTKSRDLSTSMGKLQVADMSFFEGNCNPACRVMTQYGGLYATNVCHGDDGGPAVLKEENKPEELIGVISSMDSRCWYDSTFINITSFKPWVSEVMKDEPEKYRCKTNPR